MGSKNRERGAGVIAIDALVLVVVLIFGQLAHGQSEDETAVEENGPFDNYLGPDGHADEGAGNPLDEPSLNPDSPKLDRSIIFPEVWCSEIRDNEETAQTCWEAYRAGLEYYEWGLHHRRSVLGWQHLTTRAIFFVVLFLVGIGVYFSWVQFRSSPSSELAHEIEVGLDGLKVSSPVLGVIILTLSLAFFYLYLSFVYPVQEVI